MRRYRGGEEVDPGLYFNRRQLSFTPIEEPGVLPGGEDEAYRRVPTLVLLVVAPLVGLAYLVFLPFIGFAMAAWLVGVKAGHLAQGAARAAARVLRPGWEPAMAFLSRSKPTKIMRKAADEWAEEVHRKLDQAGDNAS